MNKQEFLYKYPQYLDVPLDELARNLHAKYYPDMPFDEFAAEFGVPEARPKLEDIGRPEFEDIAPHGRFFQKEPTPSRYSLVVEDAPPDIQTYVEEMAHIGAKRPRPGAALNNDHPVSIEHEPQVRDSVPPPDIQAFAERYGGRGFFPKTSGRTPELDRQGNVLLHPERTERPSFVKEVVGGTAKDLGRLAYETAKIPYGVAETAAVFVQAAGAMPLSAVVYVRNLIDEAMDKAVYGDPVDWIGLQNEMRRVQELYMPIQPRTEFGRSTTEILSSPFTLGMEGLEMASELITDDPQKQAAIQGIGEVLLIGGPGLAGVRGALKRRGGAPTKKWGPRRGVEKVEGEWADLMKDIKSPEVRGFLDRHRDKIEKEPKRVTSDHWGVFLEEFGLEGKDRAIIRTPVEDVTLTPLHYRKLTDHRDRKRKEFIRFVRPTLERPNEVRVVGREHIYIKLFRNGSLKVHTTIVKVVPDGNFYVTNIPFSEIRNWERAIKKGDRLYSATVVPASEAGRAPSPGDSILSHFVKEGKPFWKQGPLSRYREWSKAKKKGDRLYPVTVVPAKEAGRATSPGNSILTQSAEESKPLGERWPNVEPFEEAAKRSAGDLHSKSKREFYARKGIEVGDFGPIFGDFQGKPNEAIDLLLRVKDGEAKGALYKKGIGEIDIVWGKAGEQGFGLAHILDKHSKDHIRLIPEIIRSGKIHQKHADRIYIETKDHRAVVRLDWNGRSKNWLVTTFDFYPHLKTGRTSDVTGH